MNERIRKIGPWLAAAAAAALVATHLVNAWLLDRDVEALDAGTGASLLERLGTIAIAVSAISAAYLALKGDAPVPHGVLAVLLAFLCVDDALGFHEDLSASKKIAYIPLLGAVFLLLWFRARSYPEVAWLIRSGLGLLAFSFVYGEIAERAASRYEWHPKDFGYEMKVVIKDGAELAGWILVATGLSAVAASTRR